MKNKVYIHIIGGFMVTFGILIVYLIYALWPETNDLDKWETESALFFGKVCLLDSQRLIILVLLSGLLGSYVHIGSSFSNFVGDKKFERSWIWWYILRPFIGMALALIFYFVFRGGMFSGDIMAKDLNIYGIMTMAALTGLFSDRATLKLEEIYESLFKPRDERKDKLKLKDGSAAEETPKPKT